MAELLLIGALCLSHLAFVLLALSLDRHWDALAIGRAYPQARSLWIMRCCAWLLLVVAYALSVLQAGVSMGTVLWCMLLPAAALSVALLLTWYPACVLGYARIFVSIFLCSSNRQDQ